MLKTLILAAALAATSAVHAQTKKELVQKVLQLQQPGIENAARQLAEQPAALMLQQAGAALQQRVPAERREAVARDLQAEARKYADEAVPLVREQAVKLAPVTLGPLLEERFSEDELKQLVAILESPVNRKFQQMGGDMQKALSDKLVPQARPAIEPKLRALEQAMTARLAVAVAVAGAASGPAAPASRPGK